MFNNNTKIRLRTHCLWSILSRYMWYIICFQTLQTYDSAPNPTIFCCNFSENSVSALVPRQTKYWIIFIQKHNHLNENKFQNIIYRTVYIPLIMIIDKSDFGSVGVRKNISNPHCMTKGYHICPKFQ